MKRLHAFKRGVRFRSSVTGQYVTRLFALLNPRETVSEKIGGNDEQ